MSTEPTTHMRTRLGFAACGVREKRNPLAYSVTPTCIRCREAERRAKSAGGSLVSGAVSALRREVAAVFYTDAAHAQRDEAVRLADEADRLMVDAESDVDNDESDVFEALRGVSG